MQKKIFCFVLLLFSASLLSAQNYVLSNEIKVVRDNTTGGVDTLYNAWGGAMQAPQFGWIDLDKDGKDDIVLFDRMDGTFSPYLNVSKPGEQKYRYAPQHKSLFDSCGCTGWAQFVDYSCDGLPDIMCGTPGSNIAVFKQHPVGTNGLEFKKVFDILDSKYNFGLSYLYAGRADIPAIHDVDSDGDMDFFTFGNISNYIEWHKNKAMETLGRCDTLVMEVETYCWGHFYEDNSTNSAHLHDTVNCPLNGFHPNFKTNPDPEEERHEGSTMLMLDLNGNGLKDMLIGDVSYPDLYAVYNNAGTPSHAYIDSVQMHFPSYHAQPVNIDFFPASFYGDVNNDGVKDLVCSTNLVTAYSATENYHNVSVHLNQGMNNNPDFHYAGRGFIQDENIEFGSNLSPVFMDYNKDGKLDVLLGNLGYYTPSDSEYYATVGMLENIGTNDVPVFKAIQDYTGWAVANTYPALKQIVPAVADLDKDGDEDLVLGNTLGTLYYFDNDALPNQPAHFKFMSSNLSNIDVGDNSAPAFYDIDNDGDKDLFIGNAKGWFTFCKNVSTGTTIKFDTVTTKWGFQKIYDTNLSLSSKGYAKPFIVDYDNDGQMELLVGNVMGKIAIFEDLPANAVDSLHFAGYLTPLDFGSYSSIAAAVIDSTHKLSYIVGNERGGLQLYKKPLYALPTSIENSAEMPHIFQLYPNPAQEVVNINIESVKLMPYEVSILNPLGQVLLQQSSKDAKLSIDIQNLPSGLYFVKVALAGKTEVKRLSIIR